MSETTDSRCACDAAPALLFPCSGASDVGEIADRSARKCLEQGGFAGFLHLQLADLGFEKGESPASEARIGQAVAAAARLLAS